MTARELKAEAEIRELMRRLSMRPVAYVARPEGRLAALALKFMGFATLRDGEGDDRGLLLVTRTPAFMASLAENSGGLPVVKSPAGGDDVA